MNVMLDTGAYKPVKAHKEDAGFDIKTPVHIAVPPHESRMVNTGVHVEVPTGYVGMIKTKSSIIKRECTTEGVIDAGYTGAIRVAIFNHGNETQYFEPGDKITQLVLEKISTDCKVKIVKSFKSSMRGDGGFGSTGK